MKKATIITGYITALCMSLVLTFKLTHLPGTEALLKVTGMLLPLFFAFFILDKMRENSNGNILPSHAIGAMSGALIILGVTFRLWFWPGADLFLITGLLSFGLIFIPAMVIQKSKVSGVDNTRNIAGALGLICLSLGVLFKLEYLPGAYLLLALSAALFFLVYFPRIMADQAMEQETKRRFLRNSFFSLVIGSLVLLYFAQSIEIHDTYNVPENDWYTEAVKGKH